MMAVAAQLALPTPAAASSTDIGYDNLSPCESLADSAVSKAEVILGGKMSALQELQASQRGHPKAACQSPKEGLSQLAGPMSTELAIVNNRADYEVDDATETSTVVVNPNQLAKMLANLSEKRLLAQSELFKDITLAKFMIPVKSQSKIPEKAKSDLIIPRFATATQPNGNISPASQVVTTEPPAIAPFSGKPDIFGTVALRVSHTPLDRKWSGAHNNQEAAMAKAALIRSGAILGANHKEENIRAVNRWINANIKYVEDRKLYGRADHWASAGTTLKSGQGDCEDFAIAKMQLLQASGVKASDMFLVIAKDLVRRADHSLLVIRVGNQMLVLDNETDLILNAEDVRDYRPIMSYNANGKWLHGYPAKPSETQMASLAVGR